MSWIKDPNDVLDYSVNWEQWLAGDTIVASAWTVPTGLTKVIDTWSALVTTIWLSGGTAGRSYVLTNRITTAGGRTADQSVRVIVKER